jgi:hypothetical protein
VTTPGWRRVRRSDPCPVCERPDWCLVSEDGSVCICPRVESDRRAGAAGWLHRLRDDEDPRRRIRRLLIPSDLPRADLSELADRCRRSLPPDRLAAFARSLGVSADSLAALGVGWSGDHLAWTFPMTDPATGRVVGIRLRNPDGSKYAVKGGKDALFLSDAAGPFDPLVIAEGPTDTAALLDLGFPGTVGRPSCIGGVKLLTAMIRARRPKGVVIVADADEPGRKGAEHLAGALAVYARGVRVITPPSGAKDVRAWARSGATRPDLEALIDATLPRRLGVRIREVRCGR